jgi:alkylhydroperoxidase family enzyme
MPDTMPDTMPRTARMPRIDWSAGDPALDAAMEELQAAVMVSCRDLDLVTNELARLRSARVHDCRTCRSVRVGAAAAAGVDATLTDKIDDYENSDLPERSKAALRVVDWLISRPDPAEGAVTGPARATLSQVELAELCLHVMKNSYQKVAVALGFDGIDGSLLNDEGVAYYDFREDGSRTPFTPQAPSAATS